MQERRVDFIYFGDTIYLCDAPPYSDRWSAFFTSDSCLEWYTRQHLLRGYIEGSDICISVGLDMNPADLNVLPVRRILDIGYVATMFDVGESLYFHNGVSVKDCKWKMGDVFMAVNTNSLPSQHIKVEWGSVRRD